MEASDSNPQSWHEWRRLRAVHLKQQGWHQRDIAAALGAREETVSRWLCSHASTSSWDTIPNCLGELGEIRERRDGGSAGPGPVSGFRDEPALGPVSGFRDVPCGNIGP